MGDALDQAGLFAGLSEAAFAELRDLARPFAVAAGNVLFRQGDPPSGLFVLEDGLLEIATRMPGDEEARVSQIAPGEVVGEFALLDPGPRSARVGAITDARGLFLPARGFISLLEEGRNGAVEAIDRLRTLVAARIRATLERLAAGTMAEPSEMRAAPSVSELKSLELEPATIRSLGRFASLDDAQVGALIAAGKGCALGRGVGLSPVGAAADRVTLVLRGAVRGSLMRDGRLEQVAVFAPGEWAGLVSAVDGREQPLALSAAEDSILLQVPTERFLHWRADPGTLGQTVLNGVDRQLVRDQRRANRHLGRAIALERFNAFASAA